MGEFHYLTEHEHECQDEQQTHCDSQQLEQPAFFNVIKKQHACPTVSEKEIDQVTE